MSEVTSVNSKTGAVVLKAADVEAVPTSEIGQPSGVASLNGSGKLPEAQLMSSVVNGSPTGGVPGWKAKTKYAINQLVGSSEVTYICLEAHESGETFSGVGAHWAPIAGYAVEVGAPKPTGIMATDTANLQAALNATHAAGGGLCRITKPGIYLINKEALNRPFDVSIYLAPGCEIKAGEAIAGPLISDSKTERSLRQAIYGGGIINSNNLAQNALWCRYFQRGMTLGVRCMNSTQSDVILGDLEAAAVSDEVSFTSEFMCDRNAGTVPVGYYGLWAQSCSDGRIYENVLTGQETAIRVDSGGWYLFGTHPDGAAYPMQVGMEDNSSSQLFGVHFDTPTPSVHSGATGEGASTIIADTGILSQHKGRPVVGTNIPAESFVGTVTAAASFILVNGKGEAVKPTGAVAGIELLGVGYLPREKAFLVVGGQVSNNPTYGVDQGCVGIAVGSNVTSDTVLGFRASGGNASFRVVQALVGKTSVITWIGLTQANCVNVIAGQQLEYPAESIPGSALAANAVTASKINNGAVEKEKAKAATVPAVGAEGATTLGTPGITRKIVAAFVGDGVTTAVKIKHELGTTVIRAVALKGGSREQPTVALGKWVSNGSPASAEGTYTFTAAPAKGEEMFISVEG